MVEFLESENTWAQPDSKRKSKHSQTFGLAASSTSRNSTSHRWEYLETTSSVLKVYKHFPEYCSPKQYSVTFHETRYGHSLEMTSVEGRLSTGHVGRLLLQVPHRLEQPRTLGVLGLIPLWNETELASERNGTHPPKKVPHRPDCPEARESWVCAAH